MKEQVGRVGFAGRYGEVSPAVYLILKRELRRLGDKAPYSESQVDAAFKNFLKEKREQLRTPNHKDIPDLEKFAQTFVQHKMDRRHDKTKAPVYARELGKHEKLALELLGHPAEHPDREDTSADRGIDRTEAALNGAELSSALLDFISGAEPTQAVAAALILHMIGNSAETSLKSATALLDKYGTRAANRDEKEFILSGVDAITHDENKKRLRPSFVNLRSGESDPALHERIATFVGEEKEEHPHKRDFRENIALAVGNRPGIVAQAKPKAPSIFTAPKPPTADILGLSTSKDSSHH